MVFGAFDVLHKGHVYFLNEAKKFGDFLVVVVARDLNIKTVKGAFPHENESLRLKKIQNLKIADKVLLGHTSNVYFSILEERPDIICLGYDQNSFTDHLKEKLESLSINADVIRLNSFKPDQYKSSIIKKIR